MSEWISIKDWLPGDMQNVALADFTGDEPRYGTAWMCSSGGLITNDLGNWTHWALLPPAPSKNTTAPSEDKT